MKIKTIETGTLGNAETGLGAKKIKIRLDALGTAKK
jgi:hypothetical protein